MNKNMNSTCICKSSMSFDYNIIVLLPCEHIFHAKCFSNQYPDHYCNVLYCPLLQCKQQISQIIPYKTVYKKRYEPIFKQIYIDMLSNIKYSNNINTSLIKQCYKLPYITQQLSSFMLFNSNEHIKTICNDIINKCNINIKLINKHKISNKQKIIISNHISYLDPIIIFNTFNCGFLASSIINDLPFTSNLIDNVPIIVFNRGEKNNTVTKIKSSMDKKGNDICIFPEGMITHAKTLCKFRSGAFNVGYPIQPIIIKYKPMIYSDSYKDFVSKVLSVDKIDVEIIIFDLVYPPFDTKDIENIRYNMAYNTNLKLSRVTNNFIND